MPAEGTLASCVQVRLFLCVWLFGIPLSAAAQADDTRELARARGAAGANAEGASDSLVVAGACPSRELAGSALTELDRSQVRIVVARAEGETRLVVSAAGREPLERVFQGDECEAIAEAIALVVRRHLEALGLVPPPDGAALDEAPERLAGPAAEDPASRDAEASASETGPVWIPSLGGGLEAGFGPTSMRGRGELALRARFASIASLGVLAAVATPTRHQNAGATLEHLPSSVVALGGFDALLAGDLRLRGELGAGVLIDSVNARTFGADAGSTIDVTAWLETRVALRFRPIDPLWIGLDLSGWLRPDVARWIVQPAGEVGRASRAGLISSVEFGVEVD